jgi:hypothetical protein
MRLKEAQIKALCASWKQAVSQDQGFTIGAESEQYRLLANGIGFHELSYDELRTACVELAKLLLLPGRNTIIDFDHIWLWSWMTEILIGQNGSLSSSTDREIYELAQVVARSALSGASAPTKEAFEQRRQIDQLLNVNAREYLRAGHTALSYLSFPLLEAVVRRASSAFIDLNGIVLQPFAKQRGGRYKIGNRCSNIGDSLRLLVNNVAGNELKNDISDILSHVAGIESSTSGIETIFVWRNSSLHGEATLQTIGGTVFSLALLIALDGSSCGYNSLRDTAVQRIGRERQVQELTGMSVPRSPWSFYPPY